MEITRSEAAKILGIHLRTLDRYIAAGKIVANRSYSGRITLDRNHVDALLAAHRKAAA